MAYTINLTNGTTFATITDGTVNTASSMTLVGKNYAGYGQFLDDNFIHLLENSANTTAPASPLTGQLWWDSTNTLLKVYAGGAAGFKTLGVTTASSSQPSPSIIGDLWYDTVNQQLKVCSVAGAPGTFIVVGPAYSSAQGTSGAVPITISDGSTGYIVTGLYANNNLVGIISGTTDFVPAGNSSGYATAFPTIYKGFTVWNTGNASGNISNPGNITLAVAGSVIETVASTGVFVTGLVTASGNVIGGNLRTAGLITATGNITSGNVLTAGQVSATGNVTGANFIGNVIPPAGGAVSTTGNITGGNIIFGSGVVTGTGNIIGGNVLYGSGIVSGVGNVYSGYIFGNGSQLTGVSAAVSVTKIENGTSNASIGSSGGNLTISIAGTANVLVASTTGIVVNGISTPSIEKTGSNAVGNIGSSSSYFNRLFATATTALYADVAERFAADEELAPGTVVELGGVAEITKSKQDLSENVFGVISTRAAYLMNGGAGEDDTHPPVAMTGRVPVQVIGVVRKGDRLVSAGSGTARAAQPGEATAFNVIGRALVDKLTPGPGTIEAIVTIK